MKTRIELDSLRDFCTVHNYYDDGKESKKRVRTKDVVRSLGKLMEDEPYVNLGQIPNGLYSLSVGKEADTFKCLIRVPACVVPVQYMGLFFDAVPFPELVFYFQVCEGKVNASKVWAYSSTKGVCYYPYGNVYQDGRICWGLNTYSVSCIKELERVCRAFYQLPTNSDLWNTYRISVKEEIGTLSNLYPKLDGAGFFPDEMLAPVSGLTLDSAL